MRDNRRMKFFAAAVLMMGCLCSAAEITLGHPFETKDALSVGQILESPAQYVGKVVQVKGKVTEVCQAMGCWMSLTDEAGHLLRVQVSHEGTIVFPKSSVGKMAVAEGTFGKEELTHSEAIAAAKHEAEESGRKFDATSVKSGKVVYEIAGTGAVISEN